jgi:hypothetical protein
LVPGFCDRFQSTFYKSQTPANHAFALLFGLQQHQEQQQQQELRLHFCRPIFLFCAKIQAGGAAAAGGGASAQSAHAGLHAPRKSSRQLTPEISRQYGQMQMTLSQSSLHVHARASLPTHRTHSGCVQHWRCVRLVQHSSRGQNRLAQMLHSPGCSLLALPARLSGRLNSSVTSLDPARARGRYICT